MKTRRHGHSWLLARLLFVSLAVAAAPTFVAATGAAAHAAQSAALPDRVRYGAMLELGNVDLAREWLDAGLDPNFVADRIGTGLMIGAWTGNIPLMELFVARGADIQRTNSLGETALMHASWRGHTEAVKWLLARGARINREGDAWSALHYAAFAGHGATANFLLASGANINARTPNGSTALMMAAYEGQDETARLLIEQGADRSLRNENGDGVMEWAIKYKRENIARLVGSAEQYAAAAAQQRADAAPRSLAEPPDMEEILRIRRILQSRGIAVDSIDQRIAALRAQRLRPAPAPPPRLPVLEITARRGAPEQQWMRLRY